MFSWICANLGTIVIGLALAGLIALLVCSLWKGKKQGKSSCSCGCSHCAMRGECRK